MPNPFDPNPQGPPSQDTVPARRDDARTAAPVAAGLPSGTGLGKYRILERIRTYHNAVVYKARDLMLDRLVALKQMSPELMDNPTACGNFKKEAQLLARVPKDARHVLNVHELIEDEIGLFIVEEYIDGDWLESLISKRRIGPHDAHRLLRTACIGLQDIHRQKIVHRDINPGNLMVTRTSQAKLANFYSAAQEGDITSPPVITPKYSAPELLQEQVYDDRIDLYSLGIVIYEAAVGRPAFERVFADILRSRIPVAGWIRWHSDLKESLPDPSALNPGVSPGLSAVLRQLTAKRLEERYTCVEEVLSALSRYDGRPRMPQRRPLVYQPPLIAPAPSPRPAIARPAVETEAVFSDFLASARRLHAVTSTQSVHPAAVAAANAPRTIPFERTWQSVPHVRLRSDLPRPRPSQPRPTLRIMPAPIVPPKAVFRARRRRHPGFVRAAIAIMLCVIGVGGYFALNWYLQYTPTHPIDDIVARAVDAYEHDQMEPARRLFQEASLMSVKYPLHQLKRDEASRWLIMVDAQEALKKDDFEGAQRLLRDVEHRGGVSQTKQIELQKKIWSKQDAYKTAAAGFDAIRAGDFRGAELKLDEYEKNAASSGLDPNALKDKLNLSRRQKEYSECLKAAEQALTHREFDKAFAACNNAESYYITSDTRDLRKRISDAMRQQEQLDRGDRAFVAGDYVEALASYEEANKLQASAEIEIKVRAAKAHVLLHEAREAISRGELLVGEDKLNSSIWNTPLYDAQAKLEKMRPAFDAARNVREGDRAVDLEEFERALTIYEEALPQLPEPADAALKKKINEVHRRQAVIRGEKAFKREEWSEAINALEEAQKIGFDAKVEQMLIRAKARLP